MSVSTAVELISTALIQCGRWYREAYTSKKPSEMAVRVPGDKDCDGGAAYFACYFPGVRTGAPATKRRMSSRMTLDHLPDIANSAEDHQKTASFVLRAAWALVLHYYTRSEDVCFGYDELDVGGSATSATEPPGPSSWTSVARVIIEDHMSLKEVIDQTKGKFFTAEENGLVGAAGNAHIANRSLYNTAVMLRVRRSPAKAPDAATFVQPQVAIALPEEVCTLVTSHGQQYLSKLTLTILFSARFEFWPNISTTLSVSS